MCLRPTAILPVPAETVRVARAAFPKGHPYLALRETLGTIFEDAQFAAWFPTQGQPALAPWQLALVTLLQCAEQLSDREAADAVRGRIEWKYLLGLELEDPGFDFSVLSEFRTRLVAHGAADTLLDRLLAACQAHGYLRKRGRQRTDSTHVLAAVQQLSRLELVGETFRRALNALAAAAPAWLRAQADPAWAPRYAPHFGGPRLPRDQAQRAELQQVYGADGFQLLDALFAPEAPEPLRQLPAVELLRQVWLQQYTRRDTETGREIQWRVAGNVPPAPLFIVSPTDTEARYSEKQGHQWVGYKVHFTETCDPEAPRLITDVQTTVAPVPDQVPVAAIQARLAARDLLPAVQLVDSGYVAAGSLVASREQHGVELLGPPLANTAWQARTETGYAAEAFRIDWDTQTATCPQGHPSARWQSKVERGRLVIRVHFVRAVCAACPARGQCTKDPRRARLLTLLPRAEHEALQAARARTQTAEYRREYRARSGIEGTHSQADRRCGLRHCRYLGKAKAHLQHIVTAAAVNLLRLGDWLLGKKLARTRQDPFVRLLAGAL